MPTFDGQRVLAWTFRYFWWRRPTIWPGSRRGPLADVVRGLVYPEEDAPDFVARYVNRHFDPSVPDVITVAGSPHTADLHDVPWEEVPTGNASPRVPGSRAGPW